jgi:hypothetical protein
MGHLSQVGSRRSVRSQKKGKKRARADADGDADMPEAQALADQK